jgi:steroid 5-alpha reductase family enzyme
MKALFDQQLAEFRSDPHAAKQLVQAGYAPVPETLEPCQWAAWTSVGRTLLNLHETIVRY